MGKYSIKQVLQFTKQSKFKNRFDYMERDVLKSINIQRVKKFNGITLEEDSGNFYRVQTSSYPQYKPYIDVKGKRSKKQRKIKHQYDISFEIDETLSIKSKNWKMRIGSEKNYYKGKAPQRMVKEIYPRTLKGWQKEAFKRFKTKKDQQKFIKEKKEKHKKRAFYLNTGDWQAQRFGKNLDFFFTSEWVYEKNGNLYGRNTTNGPPIQKNPKQIQFFCKHAIRFLEVMLKAGILKN